jgi:hypothetical protein
VPRYREILSYPEMLQREQIALQKGMNFRVRGGAAGYSIILMSVRKGAPYQDQWHDTGDYAGLLEYEGHDVPRKAGGADPKRVDQPEFLPSGKLTENGKFYAAALAAAAGQAPAEIVQVYEKIADGIWCDRGRHELVSAEIKDIPVTPKATKTRKVFRFYLRPTRTPDARSAEEERDLSIARHIPTGVKVAVWKRDQGRCTQCGATDNLHFDHDVPFSKGGSSITEANVKLLCARHNLSKSDMIISLGPLLGPLIAAGLVAGGGLVRGA